MSRKVRHVKRALKDYPENGISKGQGYYWWYAPRSSRKVRARKVRSRTPPRRSQLTSSEFLSDIWEAEDRLGEAAVGVNSQESLKDFAEELEYVASDLRTLAQEQEDKLGNLPDSLQESETGTLLRDRQENCERIADELDQLASELQSSDAGDDPDLCREEAEKFLSEVDWSCD